METEALNVNKRLLGIALIFGLWFSTPAVIAEASASNARASSLGSIILEAAA